MVANRRGPQRTAWLMPTEIDRGVWVSLVRKGGQHINSSRKFSMFVFVAKISSLKFEFRVQVINARNAINSSGYQLFISLRPRKWKNISPSIARFDWLL